MFSKKVIIMIILLLSYNNILISSTWKEVDSIPEKFKGGFLFIDISCYNEENCISIARYITKGAMIRITTNGGKDWNFILIDTFDIKNRYYNPPGLNSIAYIDSNLCLIACDSGIVLCTTDRGLNWIKQRLPTNERLFKIYMINKKKGYILSKEQPANYFRTSDGGVNWEKIYMPKEFSHAIWDISVQEPGHIKLLCISEDGYKVLITEDGGNTWASYNGPEKCTEFDFINKNIGYAAGDRKIGDYYYQLIYKTSDGGKTWFLQRDIYDYNTGLNDIDFIDELNGIAVGSENKIYITKDGGINWEKMPFYDYKVKLQNFGKVRYVSSSTSYLLSFNSIIKIDSLNFTSFAENDKIIEEVNIYPNPLVIGEVLNIKSNSVVESSTVIKILNIFGKNIYNQVHYCSKSMNNMQIKLFDNIPIGIYYLQIISLNFKCTIPLILLK